MSRRQLRGRHVIGCVALLLATTGSAYAGGQLAKGSATTPKLAKDAVTSAKIKQGTVKAQDLAAGVVPGDAQGWAGQRDGSTPAPDPMTDIAADRYQVTLPRAGTVVVSYFANSFAATCSPGTPVLGLYVDNKPIAGTAVEAGWVGSTPESVTTSGTVELAAGPHEFAPGVYCEPAGDYVQVSTGSTTWTVSLLAQKQETSQ